MAPVGTLVVILVVVEDVTVARTPFRLTVLLVAVSSKLVPVIINVVPIGPVAGLKLVIEGDRTAVVVTVKFDVLVPVCPATVTEIEPVAAPVGTIAVILVEVDAVTTAVVPLNLTVLFVAVVPSKLVPVIVTLVPTGPLVGLKLAIVGGGDITVKSDVLVIVSPLIVMEIGPVVAPAGTFTVRLVEPPEKEPDVIEAVVPLNFTVLFASVTS